MKYPVEKLLIKYKNLHNWFIRVEQEVFVNTKQIYIKIE